MNELTVVVGNVAHVLGGDIVELEGGLTHDAAVGEDDAGAADISGVAGLEDAAECVVGSGLALFLDDLLLLGGVGNLVIVELGLEAAGALGDGEPVGEVAGAVADALELDGAAGHVEVGAHLVGVDGRADVLLADPGKGGLAEAGREAEGEPVKTVAGVPGTPGALAEVPLPGMADELVDVGVVLLALLGAPVDGAAAIAADLAGAVAEGAVDGGGLDEEVMLVVAEDVALPLVLVLV